MVVEIRYEEQPAVIQGEFISKEDNENTVVSRSKRTSFNNFHNGQYSFARQRILYRWVWKIFGDEAFQFTLKVLLTLNFLEGVGRTLLLKCKFSI